MNIDLRVYDEVNRKQFISNIPTVPIGLIGMAYFPMTTLFEIAIQWINPWDDWIRQEEIYKKEIVPAKT